MSEAPEGLIFSQVTPTDVTNQAVVMLLRGMQDDMKGVRNDVRDVRDRVITIESQGALARINVVEERLRVLEIERDKRTGALGLVGWLSKYAPWLFAPIVASLATVYFTKAH